MFLLVDPIVLCLPEQTATSNQIINFIKHLTAWDKFIKNNSGDEFLITGKCYLSLLDAGRYPSRELMARLIDNRDDLPVNGNDVYTACRQIIESACFPSFEERIALPLANFATDIVCLDPDLLERIPPEIQESFRETFGYIAYAKEIEQNQIASNLLLLTHPIEEDKIDIDIILLVVPDESDKSEEWRRVKTDLPMAETPQDLLKLRNLTDIWEDTKQAIDLAKGQECINTNLSPYTVGSEFNQSLQDCQFPTHPNRLAQCFRKIARLLTNSLPRAEWRRASRNRGSHKPLREGRDQSGEQRRININGRDWTAWRLHITGGGNAYRLHYWLSDDTEKYVLSNVVTHDRFTIEPINEDIVAQIP